jgi:hypothetical protein
MTLNEEVHMLRKRPTRADAERALQSKNPADWDPILLLALAFNEVDD